MEYTGRIEIKGKEAAGLVKKSHAVLKQWGLKVPAVFPPLVLDFGYGEFARTGHIEYLIANDLKNYYCGKFIFMFKGQTCPFHHHRKKHETFMVVKGSIVMHLKGRDLVMKQGDILPMKQKTGHSFTARENALILEVSLPSLKGDNFFRDKRLGVV